jgi:hypothetical protein
MKIAAAAAAAAAAAVTAVSSRTMQCKTEVPNTASVRAHAEHVSVQTACAVRAYS